MVVGGLRLTARQPRCWLPNRVGGRLPRGYRSFADQLLRAGASAGANFVEGANRRTAGEKRNAFGKARGEAGEAAGHAEMLATLGLLPWEQAHRVMGLADRLCAVLTKLLQRWR